MRPILLLVIADIALFCAFSFVMVMGWQIAHHYALPPVYKANIYTPNNQIEDLKIQAIVQKALLQGYFAVDTAALAREIATVSFVRSARITRSQPLSFNISLESHQPVGYWMNRHDQESLSGARLGSVLINNFGEIFLSESPVETPLPRLWAFAASDELPDRLLREAMVHRLALWQSWAKDKGLSISAINVSPALMWEVEWNHKIRTHIGAWKSEREDDPHSTPQPSRITLEGLSVLDERVSRFLSAYPTLEKEYGNRALSVDMRYPNGLAVRVDSVNELSNIPMGVLKSK